MRSKTSARRINLASLPSFCQKLSKLVEIWRSSDENKFAVFRHGVDWQFSAVTESKIWTFKVFTALHGMQTRSSDENSVCPSVTRVKCDKTEERSVQIYIPYERTFSLVFWDKEWLVGGDPFYLKLWVNRPPFEQNRRFSTEVAPLP